MLRGLRGFELCCGYDGEREAKAEALAPSAELRAVGAEQIGAGEGGLDDGML